MWDSYNEANPQSGSAPRRSTYGIFCTLEQCFGVHAPTLSSTSKAMYIGGQVLQTASGALRPKYFVQLDGVWGPAASGVTFKVFQPPTVSD